ncbi:hypothetical protein F5B18DRAFT_641530 [Nemania serpens]|nr:hypothetical protein F5B18DRAFT_641530 [Nemania serpens]
MRVIQSAVALCAVGASAATVPDIASRQASTGTWYLVGFEPSCGSSFGCNTDYAIFGAENALPGAPAFALRCNTWGSCTSVFPGSDASASILVNAGPLIITQKFTSGGKAKTATVTVNWDGLSSTALKIPVTVKA